MTVDEGADFYGDGLNNALVLACGVFPVEFDTDADLRGIVYPIYLRESGQTVIPGATVDLAWSDCADTYTTNNRGNYSFDTLRTRAYTLTSSKRGCVFSPSEVAVNIFYSNISKLNLLCGYP